ncbi:MAG: PIN domain protein [Bacteroidetes bacterium]|jgi:hypothetical protein|nr:PIN domain protein [Bacteroidota bacterium]MBL0288924.1 PIN domain protein [Bacteroidota bacterium]MBP7257686.1 hypothetical protein [Chitinophagales bacterium]
MNFNIYIDTSVIGGYFDVEFEEATKEFFRLAIENKAFFLISDLLELEISTAPEFVRNFFKTLPESKIKKIEVTEDAKKLAMMYVNEKIVGETSLSDCQHIATATLNYAHVLVSWNFKHIVNLTRIRGYNSINLREGYPVIEIRTPKEIFKNE